MATVNYILIIVGAVVTLIGILSIFLPILTKIINLPSNERLKSIIATIIGIIIVTAGLL